MGLADVCVEIDDMLFAFLRGAELKHFTNPHQFELFAAKLIENLVAKGFINEGSGSWRLTDGKFTLTACPVGIVEFQPFTMRTTLNWDKLNAPVEEKSTVVSAPEHSDDTNEVRVLKRKCKEWERQHDELAIEFEGLKKENARLLGCLEEHQKEIYELVDRVKMREEELRDFQRVAELFIENSGHSNQVLEGEDVIFIKDEHWKQLADLVVGAHIGKTYLKVEASTYAQLMRIDAISRKVYDRIEASAGPVPKVLREKLARALFDGTVPAGCTLDTDGDGNCPIHPDGCPPGVAAFEVTGDGEKLVAATPEYKSAYERGFKAGYNKRKQIDFGAAYGAKPGDLKKVLTWSEEKNKQAHASRYVRPEGVVTRKIDGGEVDEERVRVIAEFSETKQSIIGVDCEHCGACCCPPEGVGQHGQTYVELNHADLVRLGTTAQMHMVKVPEKGRSGNTSGYFLQAYKDKDEQVRCPYFVGDVGSELHTCGCGIYEQRPYACRVFEPGDEGCLISRRNHPRINWRLRELDLRGKKKSPRDKFYDPSLGESFKTKYTHQAEKATDAALEDVSRGLPDAGEGGAEVCLATKK